MKAAPYTEAAFILFFILVSAQKLFLFHIAHLDEVFGNLYSVKGGTLLDLVAYNPEGESVFVCQVLADTAYIDGAFAGKEEGHGVFILGRIVHQHQAFAVGKGFASLFGRDGTLGLYSDALGVRTEGRYTHTHGAHLNVGVHDFACLVIHLHLLFDILSHTLLKFKVNQRH